jgi:mRNA-degrading endonuclease RelE of RelBE toxin-antitoxin system
MADLMLHQDVFDRFPRLPSKVQKKLTELFKKFKIDSTQASINLEQLQPMVRDKKVRSARLGDDYRAIIIAPEQGDTFVLIHVDHHDKAYRWCENKLFEAHQELGSFQIINIEEVERIAEEVKSEVNHIQIPEYRLNELSDDELFQAGTPRALIPSVRAVQNDDDFEKMAEYLPPEAKQVLYGFVCGLALDLAIEEMLGTSEVTKPTGPGDFSHLVDRANINLVLVEGEEHLQEILSEDIEAWRIFLHPYQRKLVEWNVKGPMKINGAAGTGKTVALMHRAIWLASQMSGNEKTIITTYTTNLAVTIKSLIEDMSPELSKRIDVTNLHQLARTICQRGGWKGRIAEEKDIDAVWDVVFDVLNNDIEFSQDDIQAEYDQIIDKMGIDNEDAYLTALRTGRPRMMRKQRKLLWPYFAAFQRELAKRNQTTFEGLVHQARLVVEQGRADKYRYVLVDELQDFGLEALKLLKAISPIDEGLSNPLCVVGDGHQRLYSRVAMPLSRAGIEVRGRSRRLKINYRTTEQIRIWAQGLLNGVQVDDLDGEIVETVGDRSVMSGSEPKVVTVPSIDKAAEAITAWAQGLLADDQYKSHEICITPARETVMAKLQSAGIQTVELKAKQRDFGQDEAGIRFGTKKRIKGLEFKAVAVILNDEDSTDNIDRFEDYVAITRAREQLLLIRIKGKG